MRKIYQGDFKSQEVGSLDGQFMVHCVRKDKLVTDKSIFSGAWNPSPRSG